MGLLIKRIALNDLIDRDFIPQDIIAAPIDVNRIPEAK